MIISKAQGVPQKITQPIPSTERKIKTLLKVQSCEQSNCEKTRRKRFWCVKTLKAYTHQTPPRRFCTLFFEVLPFTDTASVVNGKTSKKSMQKRRGGFWCVKTLKAYGFETIYVMFFKFLPISFQMKNNDEMWL